ncbi:MAG TPA: hypothetical protein VFZ48_02385 [Candidatus Saccharimonadales bacterium]
MSTIEAVRRANKFSDPSRAIAIAKAFLATNPSKALERFEALIVLAKNLVGRNTTEDLNQALRTADEARALLPKRAITVGVVDAEMFAIAALNRLGNASGRDVRLAELERAVESCSNPQVKQRLKLAKQSLL